MKAVIFDIDDTLYSYTRCHALGFDAVCRYAQAQLGIPVEEFTAAFKRQMKLLQAELGPQAAVHNRAIRFQRILEERKLGLDHADTMEELYWDTLIRESRCEPGLEQCLQALKAAGYTLGIGSNMTLTWQLKKLKRLGLTAYFDFVVSSEEAGVEKPDRRLFALCARKAGAAMDECIFVGDSLEHDVLGAEAAGMKAVWYAPGREDFLGHPGISHYAQLQKLLLVL